MIVLAENGGSKRSQSPFRGSQAYFKDFSWGIHNFFKWTAYRKPYWKCLVKYSAHFVAYVFFYLLNNATYRWEIGRFSRLVNKYLLFFRFTDFLRGSGYFSSIVISINFYYVECGDGRQPGILVGHFWISRSKTRTFSTPGFLTETCYCFFSH